MTQRFSFNAVTKISFNVFYQTKLFNNFNFNKSKKFFRFVKKNNNKINFNKLTWKNLLNKMFKFSFKQPFSPYLFSTVDYNYLKPLVYRIFFNSFIKNGNRHKAFSISWIILQNIRKKKWWKYVHNHVTLDNIFSNLLTPVRVRKKKVGGRIELIPSVPTYKKTVGVATRWLKKGAKDCRKKYKVGFVRSMINEMGNAFKRTGLAYYERKLLEYQSEINRKNVKYLRRRISVSRSNNKFERNKFKLKRKKIIKFKAKYNTNKIKRLNNL